MKSARNPDGVPKEVVDGIRDGTANHRSQFYKDITMAFYGFNGPGANVSEGIRENWWRQGMMGSIKAQYECIRVLSETEFYNDLDVIDVPVLVMHGMPTTHAETINADLLAFYQGVTRPVQLGEAVRRTWLRRSLDFRRISDPIVPAVCFRLSGSSGSSL